eukprot:scaffold113723_cov51-Attheya_sp.AAC.1
MLGPSALFNTGYRHRANGDGKEPWSVPMLRLTFCFLRRKPECRLMITRSDCTTDRQIWQI